MSLRAKIKFSRVQVSRRPSSGARASARISSSKCCDPVESVQEAGAELSELFGRLKNEELAAKLIYAIRCHDCRKLEQLLGCNCRVVNFFCTSCADCVRICCTFGRCKDVTISFTICVERSRKCCSGRSRGC
ncbi:hypothetical protein ACFO9Q_04065 [Paenibacillus sp. GCM10023252]|uniref:hypothetical protein n=1 Tax=Paenibacillus sp. GCM10023252 TaxID=3252649 RepID=UPI00362080EE